MSPANRLEKTVTISVQSSPFHFKLLPIPTAKICHLKSTTPPKALVTQIICDFRAKCSIQRFSASRKLICGKKVANSRS